MTTFAAHTSSLYADIAELTRSSQVTYASRSSCLITVVCEAKTLTFYTLSVSCACRGVLREITDATDLSNTIYADVVFAARPCSAGSVLIIARTSLSTHIGEFAGLDKADACTLITISITFTLIITIARAPYFSTTAHASSNDVRDLSCSRLSGVGETEPTTRIDRTIGLDEHS